MNPIVASCWRLVNGRLVEIGTWLSRFTATLPRGGGATVQRGGSPVEFRVLGPVQALDGNRVVPVPAGRVRTLLAVLLLHAGQVVTVPELAAQLWADQTAPANPRAAIQTYIGRLRQSLGGELIQTRPRGYLLALGQARLDLTDFRRLVDQATRTAAVDKRAHLLGQALDLWHGQPLADVGTELLTRTQAPRLIEERLHALVQCMQARLELGQHASIVAELTTLVRENPLREQCTAQLMLALYRCGRRADALAAYRTLYRHLADELGVEPGASIHNLHQQILSSDPALDLPQRLRPTGVPVPRQLPAGIGDFTGRADCLDRLDALLAGAADRAPTAVVISAIAGTAGIGKTTLAVHWAHRVRDRFPDGQLYVNLRGFDPAGATMSPADAVRGFLDALRVPAERIPADLDAKAALYRSQLADRRMLVVLDNARDAGQVRPLLPGSPGCLVLITSRNQLTGLVATEGAQSLTLDLLTAAEARLLLTSRLGKDRVAAEPDAVDRIIEACARLPLALAVVAARAATHPTFPLGALAAQLRAARGLDAFAATDAATDVRTVFSWSYRSLSPAAARLFRLLGLHLGPDISAAAAASLAGLAMPEAQPLLAELTRTHLVTASAPDRYTCHDLLRAYATELANGYDTEADRQAAVHRVLDHYAGTARTAAMLLNPHLDPIPLDPLQPGVTLEQPVDHAQAQAWFTAEHAVLLAAIEVARSYGFDTHTLRLATALNNFLDRQGHWHDSATIQRAALDAAHRLADRPGQAQAHTHLANAYARLGRYDDAHTQLSRAIDRYGELRDPAKQAYCYQSLSWLFDLQGRHDEGLRSAQRALELHRATGDRYGQACALNAVGWDQAQAGDHQQALLNCEQALALFHELDNQHGQAHTLDSLGYIHHLLGAHHKAIACYRQALDLFQEVSDRDGEATALVNLGDASHSAGDQRAAHDAWRRALDILEELDHPGAGQVQEKVRKLASSGITCSTVRPYAPAMPAEIKLAEHVQADTLRTRIDTTPELDSDPPALRVSWIKWDSGFRGSGLRPGDRIIAVNGQRVTSSPLPGQGRATVPNCIGHYSEHDAWKDAAAKEGAPVALTIRRRNSGAEGWSELTVTGELRSDRTYTDENNRRRIGPNGPQEMYENDGFDRSWMDWYDRVSSEWRKVLDDGWLTRAFTSEPELESQERDNGERVRLLAEKYPGPFAAAVTEDWAAVSESLRGRSYELPADALDFRKLRDLRAAEVSAAGRKAREAFLAAHAAELIPAFPVIDPILGDRSNVVGKLVELPVVTQREWISQGTSTCFVFGQEEYCYSADAESPGVQRALEAERRYEQLVMPIGRREFAMIARILPESTMVVENRRARFGFKVEPVGVSLGDSFFIDVSSANGGPAKFAGEEELKAIDTAMPPDDASPRAVIEAFYSAIKVGDQELWSSMYGDWVITFTANRLPLIMKSPMGNTENMWNDARRRVLEKICDVRVVWVDDIRPLVTGKEFDGAPRIDQTTVEVDHIRQLPDGTFRSFLDVGINRVWTLQRYNDGPWRIAPTIWGI